MHTISSDHRDQAVNSFRALTSGTCLAVATQWSRVAWANLFARADSIVDTGKLSHAPATQYTLNTYTFREGGDPRSVSAVPDTTPEASPGCAVWKKSKRFPGVLGGQIRVDGIPRRSPGLGACCSEDLSDRAQSCDT